MNLMKIDVKPLITSQYSTHCSPRQKKPKQSQSNTNKRRRKKENNKKILFMIDVVRF